MNEVNLPFWVEQSTQCLEICWPLRTQLKLTLVDPLILCFHFSQAMVCCIVYAYIDKEIATNMFHLSCWRESFFDWIGVHDLIIQHQKHIPLWSSAQPDDVCHLQKLTSMVPHPQALYANDFHTINHIFKFSERD